MEQRVAIIELQKGLLINTNGTYHLHVNILEPLASLHYEDKDHTLKGVVEVDVVILPLTSVVKAVPLILD